MESLWQKLTQPVKTITYGRAVRKDENPNYINAPYIVCELMLELVSFMSLLSKKIKGRTLHSFSDLYLV